MGGARPGWYPDPARAGHGYRWWDGSEWTDAVGEHSDAASPTRLTQLDSPTGRTSGAAVLGVGVALVAVVGVLLGLVVGRQPSTPSTARAAAGSTPLLAGVPGQLDVANRTASIAAARMALPDEPYVMRADPLPLSGPIEECFLASAQVHSNYDGHHDWSAMVGLAHVRPSPGSPADLEVAATAVLQQFAGHFFDGSPTTVSKPTLVDHPVDGRPGVLLTARVGYRIRHFPSRYDAVRVVVVQVDNGSTVAAFSSVPSDAPSQLERLATDSLRSLQVG